MVSSVSPDGGRYPGIARHDTDRKGKPQHSRSGFLRLFLLLGVVVLLGGCAGTLGRYHTVQKGETLYSISQRYDVPVKKIAQVNALRNPDVIYPGERLYIPGAKPPPKTTVASTSSGSGGQASSSGNAVVGPLPEPTSSRPFAWPARGLVVSRFGPRHGRMHNGIDIAAKTGEPVFAARSGKVIFASDHQRGYGRIIIIQHDETFITVYAHNSKNLVKEGDRVQRGQTIGLIGRTGNATGPHLHFEIRRNRKPVNPLKYLPTSSK